MTASIFQRAAALLAFTIAVFSTSLAFAAYRVLHEFEFRGSPFAPITLNGSTLYGTTSQGGMGNDGTLFKMNLDGTGFEVLHEFDAANDGGRPLASLTLSGSTLYGTAFWGGHAGFGTVFKMNLNGTGFTVLHEFAGGGSGAHPWAPVILNGSTLYGTTWAGGDADSGTLFKLNLDGTGFEVLHQFAGNPNDGARPLASLTLGGSTLYGTTARGGISDHGTVFKMNLDGTGYGLVHEFVGYPNDGEEVWASVTLSGSTLYGTTSGGGNSGYGTGLLPNC
jgi:uncharacterized repeat protein (TIGR03803 family)